MYPLHDNDLDRMSRNAAEHYEMDFGSSGSGWEQLEKRLDQELPPPRNRRRFLFWMFFIVVVTGGALIGLLINGEPLTAYAAKSIRAGGQAGMDYMEGSSEKVDQLHNRSTSAVQNQAPTSANEPSNVASLRSNSTNNRSNAIGNQSNNTTPVSTSADNQSNTTQRLSNPTGTQSDITKHRSGTTHKQSNYIDKESNASYKQSKTISRQSIASDKQFNTAVNKLNKQLNSTDQINSIDGQSKLANRQPYATDNQSKTIDKQLISSDRQFNTAVNKPNKQLSSTSQISSIDNKSKLANRQPNATDNQSKTIARQSISLDNSTDQKSAIDKQSQITNRQPNATDNQSKTIDKQSNLAYSQSIATDQPKRTNKNTNATDNQPNTPQSNNTQTQPNTPEKQSFTQINDLGPLSQTPNKTSLNSPLTSDQPAFTSTDSTESKNQKVPHTYKQPLEISITAGPDGSMVDFGPLFKAGYNVGLQIGYRFNNRWSVNTGLIYTRKYYQTDSTGFHAPKHSNPSYYRLESLKGYCAMFDIPVNIRYDISYSDKRRLFASVGASSYFMNRQYYDWSGWTYNTNQYKKDKWDSKTTKDYFDKNSWFSVLNLSVGYERQMSKHLSIQAEPYLKIPLTGMGYGTMKIGSYGMFFSVKYRPTFKSTPKK